MADKDKAEKPAAPKFDSVPRGSVDLWPVLVVPGPELARQIAAGAHDGVLGEIASMEAGHGKRDIVIEACRARRG